MKIMRLPASLGPSRLPPNPSQGTASMPGFFGYAWWMPPPKIGA